MSDYEIIGRITVWLGAAAIGLIFLRLLLLLAWYILQEALGWPRIRKALQMLHDSERGEG